MPNRGLAPQAFHKVISRGVVALRVPALNKAIVVPLIQQNKDHKADMSPPQYKVVLGWPLMNNHLQNLHLPNHHPH